MGIGQLKRERIMRDKKGKFIKGHKGISGFAKGSKHTEEAKKKISKSLYGKKGKFARRWKGKLAGYVATHIWLTKTYGKPKKCENVNCSKKYNRIEWASISGDNLRMSEDYLHLCTSCHRKYDFGHETITKKGIYQRTFFIQTVCPKCKHKHEVKYERKNF